MHKDFKSCLNNNMNHWKNKIKKLAIIFHWYFFREIVVTLVHLVQQVLLDLKVKTKHCRDLMEQMVRKVNLVLVANEVHILKWKELRFVWINSLTTVIKRFTDVVTITGLYYLGLISNIMSILCSFKIIEFLI